ncbi:MAG: carbamoyl-phosphate synthase large subunit [Acutalibacteraceae bacterium]|nr:carbamoyl-phosphate synthase large subunit [Acutalibacteraceae bacterium]
MPLNKDIKKVLVIGSGPIVIGQAAEFDYAGAQACRVLKEAGVNVVLVNSNPATIMTDKALADEIYLEPLTAETVKRIIEIEKPDSLLAGLGGQVGLTLAMQLWKENFLQSHGVRLIGTDVEAIDKAEDRQLFRDTMEEIGQPCIPSDISNDVETSVEIANRIGYPVIIRPAFTLGGAGGGVAYNEEELRLVAKTGLDASPITQVLVERYIKGWKEIEFETMRDNAGNTIAICSMENFDPVGVHTGDSIVCAPALTLSNKEYSMLRQAALDIVSALKIVGGCNCQFALNPESFEYAVIEVNPRVSRSSALASKATGYPIAKMTTKLALGYNLDEILNDITGKTCACFEPSVDYVVVKFPKWPFDKFLGSSRKLGTQMKATGEVMSIGHSFENAVMKAIRGAEISLDSLNAAPISDLDILQRLDIADDRRIFTIFEAIKAGVSIEKIHEITAVDEWFIHKLKNLADFENEISGKEIDEDTYLRAKKLGYTDKTLAKFCSFDPAFHLQASYKMVDTCGAEFSATTPYFYSSYDKACEARRYERSGKPVVMVLGSGPIRIGQGIEFDYSSVHCVWTLKELGYDVVIVNNNPETVSTDYDTADRLYFEPLCEEDVMNIIEVEKPVGVVVAFGGQTAIKLTKFLDDNGIKILGTSQEGIDTAEDREKFDALLEKFGFLRPQGCGVMTLEEALEAANRLTYPVLLRPSYVIGGQNMMIVHNDVEVERYMKKILSTGIENPVLVDKYMSGTEIEVDVISDGKDVLIPGIMQHIERAGVHSGDSIAVYPPYSLTDKMTETVVECSEKLALALGTKGLVNIQYLIYENQLYIIEVNPRASRTIPYISKVTNVPMVDLATKVMTGTPLKDLGYGTGLYEAPPYFAAKAPVFSFEKLNDVNSYLGPEMKSTGEVLGIGKTLNESLFKALVSSGFSVKPTSGSNELGVLISVDEHDLDEIVSIAKKMQDLGINIFATKETARAIVNLGINVTYVKGITESDYCFKLLESGKINFIVYTGALFDETMDNFIALRRKALQHGIACFTSLDTANAMLDIMASNYTQQNTELIDINSMRKVRNKFRFAKMQGTGNDYIFIDNRNGEITCPESLCINFCDRHTGIGGYGIVLLENSDVADARMRIFNRDGSEGKMAGNAIRCVAKMLYDKDIVKKEEMTIETGAGVKNVKVYTSNGRVVSTEVYMGKPTFVPAELPCTLDEDRIIDYPITIGSGSYNITCVGVGNPHCVVFLKDIDSLDLNEIGPCFEKADIFPERINTEFVRVVNRHTIKMRAYERGNKETFACGTGAAAAVVAAVENGFCDKGEEITVKLKGGDLAVTYDDNGIFLTGNAVLVYEGEAEY